MPDAYILGIESSCDETAAAVVRSGEELISNVVASQIATHQPYGGVVPELASREHLRAIVPVVRQALAEAKHTYNSVDAIAVTQGPGLAGALLVGISYAKAPWKSGKRATTNCNFRCWPWSSPEDILIYT
jgi:N6-L-threonylcarbamoyladenine synthase